MDTTAARPRPPPLATRHTKPPQTPQAINKSATSLLTQALATELTPPDSGRASRARHDVESGSVSATSSRVPSPPLTPLERPDTDPFFENIPSRSVRDDFVFDVAHCKVLGTGLWSVVYKVGPCPEPDGDREPASPMTLNTPPITPQKGCAPELPLCYAVKTASRPDAGAVFEHEAHVLGILQDHADAARHIIPFFGWANDKTALVFHAATEGSLESFWASHSSLTRLDLSEEFGDLLRQTTAGLAFLHDAGIIHGDIKPANILVDHGIGPSAPHRYRFCDFSASRELEEELSDISLDDAFSNSPSSLPSRASSTRQNFAGAGTWSFMAPEQLSTNPLISAPTRASDVYSLGMTLLTILLGANPYAELQKNHNVFLSREAIKQGTPMRFARDDMDASVVLSDLERTQHGMDTLACLDLALKKAKSARISSHVWAQRCASVAVPRAS